MDNSPDSYLIRGDEIAFNAFIRSGINERRKFIVFLHRGYQQLAGDELPEDHSSYLYHLPEEVVIERIRSWVRKRFSAIIAGQAKTGCKELGLEIVLLCDWDEEEEDYTTEEDWGSPSLPLVGGRAV